MAINVSLNAFTGAARNAGGALRVTDDGLIQKSSGLRELFPTREMKVANRETMVKFLSALKTRYGEHVANLVARDLQSAIKAGKPLTARAIRAVVGEAEHITESLAMFLSGVDSSGKTIEHSLDKAVEAWETTYPKEAARMTPEERQTAKERIAKELMAGNPVCHSPKEMFQAVLRPAISGNVTVASALTGVAAVQAREASEASFTQAIGGSPGKELVRNLTEAGPTFQKDIIRGTNLTVGNHRVVNKAGNFQNSLRAGQSAEQAVVENGYDEIARLLTGQEDVRFADLPKSQQKQVLLLSGLCCQELEVPVLVCAQLSFFDASGAALSIAKGGLRSIHLEKNGDGNLVVRFDANIPISTIDDGGSGWKRTMLDPSRSRLEAHAELVFSPNELERLARLDWTGVPTEGKIPEDHQMHFMESHFSSSLTLHAAE